MCGVAAVLGPGATAGTAARMAAALRHRGPDRVAARARPAAAVAAARLAVTGPGEAGDQPMADGGLLVFNGEIHNHRALRARLPRRGYRGDSDTETLLAALDEWGGEALSRLEGPFAFVHVARDTGVVTVARDRFGVKPLYLAHHGGRWFVASEIKALLAGGVPAVVDPAALRAVVADYWTNGVETPLRGIRRVPAGAVLTFDAEGRLLGDRRWFEPADLVDPGAAARQAALSPEEWEAELEAVLRAAVRSRLPQDPGTGAGVLCSGGLDSSLVLALANAEGRRLPAYVASFPDQPEADETGWAAEVARFTGSPLTPVEVTADVWREHFAASVWHFEYPLVHQNSVALAAVAHRARADGLRVLLSGEGADELFGGYPSRHRAQRLAFGVGAGSLEVPARRNDALRAALEVGAAADAEYARRLRESLDRAFAHLPGSRRALAVALAGDLRLFLSHGLNRLDKNLMQASIEAREPFLATGVAAFAVNAPLERHLAPVLKAGLAAVARRRLPAAVVDRKKSGFNFSLSSYSKGLDERCLENGVLRTVLKVPSGRWRTILANVEERTKFRLWSAEVWCRLFVEGAGIAEVNGMIWRE
ncbi:asparagine synthase (glutamine-hydrolyzing) [Amycolatopsis sp. NPDC051102]|uniref:asparagine synthase (glutamine-hydrolyzing) n=1 Tax=Amycolatopsis sp. NPDC051102 TaxID=3155163 RepID=UPI00342D914A